MVMDQLNQIPARISHLSLLLNSEAHRRVLLKILNKCHVVHDISVVTFMLIITLHSLMMKYQQMEQGITEPYTYQ